MVSRSKEVFTEVYFLKYLFDDVAAADIALVEAVDKWIFIAAMLIEQGRPAAYRLIAKIRPLKPHHSG